MFGSQTKKDASLETVEEEAGTPTSLEASAPEASVEESAPSKPKSNFWGGSASKSFTGLGESSSSSAPKVNAQLRGISKSSPNGRTSHPSGIRGPKTQCWLAC